MSNFSKTRIEDSLGNELVVGSFGAAKMSLPTSQIANTFSHALDLVNDFMLDTPTGAGTTVAQHNRSLLKVSSGAIGTTGLRTRVCTRYRPGSTIECDFTANWSGAGVGQVNHSGLIGLFDDSDGVYLGYQGVNFIVGYRNKYKTAYVVPASSGDADVTAIVDMSAYDLTKIHRFRIMFGYLGVGNISFQIFSGGAYKTIHVFETDGALPDRTHVGIPVLPMRAVVSSTVSDISIFSGSWSAITFGSPYSLQDHPHFLHGVRTVVPGAVGATPSPVLALRSLVIFEGYPNKILSQLVEASLATGSEGLYRYVIYPVTPGTFIDGDPGTVGAAEIKGNFTSPFLNSPIQVSVDIAVGASVPAFTTPAHSSLVAVASSGAGVDRIATDFTRLGIFATAGSEFLVTMEEIIAGAGVNTTAWDVAFVDRV